MKKIINTFKKHKKTIIALTAAAAVSVLIYTDVFNIGKDTPVTDYLYNMNEADAKAKILGEAKLVDNMSGTYEEVTANEESYFSNAAVNREKSRDEALETLQVVVDSAEEFPETRDKALAEIMQIASDIEIEASVEEMIKAKGFEDCVAIISGDNINVIVKSDGLLTSEIAQITDIVKSETGYIADRIRIIEKV